MAGLAAVPQELVNCSEKMGMLNRLFFKFPDNWCANNSFDVISENFQVDKKRPQPPLTNFCSFDTSLSNLLILERKI